MALSYTIVSEHKDQTKGNCLRIHLESLANIAAQYHAYYTEHVCKANTLYMSYL